MGPNFCDEIDLFDNIDDLIQFPPDDNESVGGSKFATSDDSKDVVPAIWTSTLPEFSADLSVPYEDIAQMEWLSVFVEDSFSAEGGLTIPKHASFVDSKDDGLSFSHPWSFQSSSSSPVSVLESHSSSSSTNSSCLGAAMLGLGPHRGPRSKRPRPAAFSPRPPTFIELLQTENYGESQPLKKFPRVDFSGAEELKKKKKKKIVKTTIPPPPPPPPSGGNREEDRQNTAPVRKCLHCEITKTPQWRAGPMGPKTLCNACGVRFKSGRLFPEYRPAASPTFVPSVHSNSHKKVVEMRNKGGVVETPATTVPELVSNP